MGSLALREDKFSAVGRAWPLLEAAQHHGTLARVPLVDRAELPAVIGDLERALTPPDRSDAEKMTRMLLGCYPRHGIEDPDMWNRAMIASFAEYPGSIGYEAVDRITRRLKFIPTRAELVEELEGLRRPLLEARAMAMAMEREHQRRADDATMQASIDASRAAFKAEYGDRPILEVIREKAAEKEQASNGLREGN